MPELILSDITVMGPGYCVIGLEQLPSGAFRSVRPMPPWGFAWRDPFSMRRGEHVTLKCRQAPIARPHVEDIGSFGSIGIGRVSHQEELVGYLKRAEVSHDLEHLFGCPARASSQGGGALWVKPSEAVRSVCGCEYTNLRFRLFPAPPSFNLRAELTLASNERVPSIPIVDREWRRFTDQLVKRAQGAGAMARSEQLLNGRIRHKLLLSTWRFARLGLPRPREDEQCWLMLDSLFPQPDESWLEMR